GLSAEAIRGRLTHHLALLGQLVQEATTEFHQLMRTAKPPVRLLRCHSGAAKLREAVVLAEELSPRTELLDDWTLELQQQQGRMNRLVAELRTAVPADGPSLLRELREIMHEAQATPEELGRLV